MVAFTDKFDEEIKKRFWSLYTLVKKEEGSHAMEYLDAIERATAIQWDGTKDNPITEIVYQSTKKEINGIYSTSDSKAVHLTKLLLQELAKETPIYGITDIQMTTSNQKYIRLLTESKVIGRSNDKTGKFPIQFNAVYITYKEEPLRRLLKKEYDAAEQFIGKQQHKYQQAMMITEQQQEKRIRQQERKKNIQRVAEAKSRVLKLQDWLNKLREETKNPTLLFRTFEQTETLDKIYNKIPDKKTLFYLYKSNGVYHPKYFFNKDDTIYRDTNQANPISFPVYIPVVYSYSDGFSEKEQQIYV